MNEHARKIESKFNEWAQSGDAKRMEDSHGPFAKQGFDALQLKPKERYLDIGCGNGYSVRWALDVDASIRAEGIDISPDMIEVAKQQSSHDSRASFRSARWPDDACRNQSYDAVFSMEVFYYLADLNEAIQNVYRILKPGGRFACLVDYYQEHEASHEWPKRMGLSMHLLSQAEWVYELKRVGFTNIISQRLVDSNKPEFIGTLMTLGTKG